MKVAAVISARTGSTRLDRKVLMNLCGQPLISHVIRRSMNFPGISSSCDVVLAIPHGDAENDLAVIGESNGVTVFRGSEEDVLSRVHGAAKAADARVIYRITGDNPLIDPGVVFRTWHGFTEGNWDYAVMEDTPLGTTAEVISVEALERAKYIADSTSINRYREHPTLALYENGDLFRMRLIPCPDEWNHPDWRFTVDTPEDHSLVERIMNDLGRDAALEAIVPYIESNPEILNINRSIKQEGWKNLKEKKDAIGKLRV